MKKVVTAKELRKMNFPRSAILGVLLAMAIGVGGLNAGKIKNFYQYKEIFPESGVVAKVEDGDTMELDKGQRVRLIGVNAPERGKENYGEAKEYLSKLVTSNKIWLEYDRYQDDKFGRILAWVWLNCETEKPEFKPADYMHLNGKESRPYLTEKPEGCKEGELLNQKLVEAGMAVPVKYEGRGRLKYEIK